MKYYYNRTNNSWNPFGIEYLVLDYLCIFDFFYLTTNNWKCYNLEIQATKYTREKTSDPQNTHEENLGPAKKPRRHNSTMALDPQYPLWDATHEIYHILL